MRGASLLVLAGVLLGPLVGPGIAQDEAPVAWIIDGQIPLPELATSAAAWAPGGSVVAAAIGDQLALWDSETGEVTTVVAAKGHRFGWVSWSPDGRYIGTVSSAGLTVIVDAPAARVAAEFWGISSDWNRELVHWSPDSDHVAAVTGSYGVQVVEADSGRVEAYLDCPEGCWPGSLAWSPNGSWLAAGGAAGMIWIWGRDGSDQWSEVAMLESLAEESAASLLWSPDGRLLLAGAYQQASIRVWHPETGRVRFEREEGGWSVKQLAWSPAGDQLAYAAYTGYGGSSLNIARVTPGDGLQHRASFPGYRLSPTPWSADGTRLLAIGAFSPTVMLIDPADLGHREELPVVGAPIRAATGSLRDGRILTTTWDGEVLVWRRGLDADGDGHADADDALPHNPEQWLDRDGDGWGDSSDGAGGDAFPDEPTQWTDRDRDGFGDNPAGERADAFPSYRGQWLDSDGDGWGDNQAEASGDRFPDDPTQWKDVDGDGHGDNPGGADADPLPQDPSQWADADQDGHGDNPVGTAADQYPNDASEWRDSDADGLGNSRDPFPEVHNQAVIGIFAVLGVLGGGLAVVALRYNRRGGQGAWSGPAKER